MDIHSQSHHFDSKQCLLFLHVRQVRDRCSKRFLLLPCPLQYFLLLRVQCFRRVLAFRADLFLHRFQLLLHKVRRLPLSLDLLCSLRDESLRFRVTSPCAPTPLNVNNTCAAPARNAMLNSPAAWSD